MLGNALQGFAQVTIEADHVFKVGSDLNVPVTKKQEYAHLLSALKAIHHARVGAGCTMWRAGRNRQAAILLEKALPREAQIILDLREPTD